MVLNRRNRKTLMLMIHLKFMRCKSSKTDNIEKPELRRENLEKPEKRRREKEESFLLVRTRVNAVACDLNYISVWLFPLFCPTYLHHHSPQLSDHSPSIFYSYSFRI